MRSLLIMIVTVIWFLCGLISYVFADIQPSVAFYGSLAFGDTTVGDKNPGGNIEGYVRFNRYLGAGAGFNYHLLEQFEGNWIRFGFHVGAHLLNEDSPFDLQLGAGIYDSIIGGEQGLSVTGRLGTDIWFLDRFAVSVLMEYHRGINVITQEHPSFSAIIANFGIKYRF